MMPNPEFNRSSYRNEKGELVVVLAISGNTVPVITASGEQRDFLLSQEFIAGDFVVISELHPDEIHKHEEGEKEMAGFHHDQLPDAVFYFLKKGALAQYIVKIP